MLARFCKLCYKTADHSFMRPRRFSMLPEFAVDEAEKKRTDRKKKETVQEEEEEEGHISYEDSKFLGKTKITDGVDILDSKEETPVKKDAKKIPIVTCKKHMFDAYLGTKVSKFKALPLASRGWLHRKARGDYFTIHPYEKPADQFYYEMDKKITFGDLGLNKELVQSLADNNLVHPTQIQKIAIPQVLESHNSTITAETGCGKTIAYLAPLLQQISKWKSLTSRGCNHPLALILTPSRELSAQIGYLAKKYSNVLGIKTVVLVGGSTKSLTYNPPVTDVDLIVGTLGTMSKLSAIGIYKLDFIRHVVLDEADTLFDDTFSEKLRRFLRSIPIGASRINIDGFPDTAQLTLTSATMPQDIPDILNDIVSIESLLDISTGNAHRMKVPQKFYRIGLGQKPMTLLKIVKPKAKTKHSIIVFSNTTATSFWLSVFLNEFGVRTVHLSGHMDTKVRKSKLLEFQNGQVSVLSTTDAGSRGLDTVMACDVINYDFPLITAEYIHRCGRVGRVGSPRDCRIINFISRTREVVLAKRIETAARKLAPIPLINMLNVKLDDADEEMKVDDTFKGSEEEEDYSKEERYPSSVPY